MAPADLFRHLGSTNPTTSVWRLGFTGWVRWHGTRIVLMGVSSTTPAVSSQSSSPGLRAQLFSSTIVLSYGRARFSPRLESGRRTDEQGFPRASNLGAVPPSPINASHHTMVDFCYRCPKTPTGASLARSTECPNEKSKKRRRLGGSHAQMNADQVCR